ncbi:flavin reductase family protein [Streptomyces leeuwenhoekii]|uniref:Flavin-dependent monooxygenase, reductase subunit n=1 Tax=Streptomyces leeuwenhoekii TaxID=1437453 RepID=A0A0F7W740_STRLW|nr:flavin reductase family protein [Streptomyces leeuwenhoekii]CQR65727.1 Flavin-dependent monooxygenase, reductase subunit [Streptomyces leeuwenhoekii]
MVAPFDATDFRRTLGCLPTGVTVITAATPSGRPVGMACNSFVSVSLEPPLVMFCAGDASSTLTDLRSSGTFCVNILGSAQGALCRQFSVKGIDRFAGVRWTESAAGPELCDALAWMSCAIDTEHVAGDHVIIIARVTGLRVNQDEPEPLVFHRGRFGSFRESTEPLAVTGALPRQTPGGGTRAPSATPSATPGAAG